MPRTPIAVRKTGKATSTPSFPRYSSQTDVSCDTMAAMRVEPYEVGSYLHVLKRGARGLPIVGDEFDRQRFLRVLFHMNDAYLNENWDRIALSTPFERPASWPKRKPLVAVLAYTLMPNHIHLFLREIRDGGTSLFMKKIGQSMTNHHNEKYNECGSLFQGPFMSRTIGSDRQLQYVAAYIMVKNTFELYPQGGLRKGAEHFEKVWSWACAYPFSSLGGFMGVEDTPILNRESVTAILPSPTRFKEFARDVISGGQWYETDLE